MLSLPETIKEIKTSNFSLSLQVVKESIPFVHF